MRTATLILATLLLLGTAGMGFLGTKKTLSDAKDIDQVYSPMKAEITAMAKAGDKSAKEIQSLGEATGRMKIGGVGMAIAGLIALALIGLMFANKYVPQAAVGLVAVALLAIVLSPQYDTGATGGASARTLAYIVAALGAIGAASAYGSKALKDRA